MRQNSRKSNIEALRIVAMLFIVVWHILVHILPHAGINYKSFVYRTLAAITITGVDIFVLISGYFGIRLNFKRFANLYLTVVFYSLLGIFATLLLRNDVTTLQWVNVFFVMSGQDQYWFVYCYLMLMLISPAINLALDNSNTKQYVFLLGVLAYISFVTGWILKRSVNLDGYNLFQFVFLYVLGHGIRRFDIPYKLKQPYWLMIYVTATVGFVLLAMVSVAKAYRYNDPLVVLAAASLLCFFTRLDIKSHAVNWAASCMFAVYLLQDGLLGRMGYKIVQNRGENILQGIPFVLLAICYVIATFGTTFLIECIRRPICVPILRYAEKVFDRLKLLLR